VGATWDYLWLKNKDVASNAWNKQELSDNNWTKKSEIKTEWEKQ
jgi:hypothetical protein